MGLKGYKRPILMDVDGVLANFTYSFTYLCRQIDSDCTVIYHPHSVDKWNFPHIPEHVQAKAWNKIRESTMWWMHVEPLLTTQSFRKLNRLRDVLYVSSREGYDVYDQTHRWLQLQGILNPNVVIVPTGDVKYEIVDALKAKAIVDDRPSTLERMRLYNAFRNEDTVLVLAPKYPYNADKEGIMYYTNPDEMLEMLA